LLFDGWSGIAPTTHQALTAYDIALPGARVGWAERKAHALALQLRHERGRESVLQIAEQLRL
jgi:hypothetical protein